MKTKLLLIIIISALGFGKLDAQTKHSATARYKNYEGLVMAGYQGWHNTPEDGSGRGWGHYLQRGEFAPGNCKIDMWPESQEYPKMYNTPFKHADGSAAFLPSDHDFATTDVRFRWMKEYGIDGVFMQRFVSNIRNNGILRNHFNKVLSDALIAGRKYDRAVAVMYDLSGMRDSVDVPLILRDWRNLVDSMKITSGGNDQPYLYHNNKPLVALWGVGFAKRKYTLQSIEKIIDFLKHDNTYGGCSVMLGMPTYWRTLDRDTEPDPHIHNVIRKVDIIHPWTVGRYKDEKEFKAYSKTQQEDIAWCKENKVGYTATAFPGFSWSNLNRNSPFNQIPRNRGRFYWSQLSTAIKNGVGAIYVAMFDEVDEGTAIMKVSRNPPEGPSRFVTFEPGIPEDYYLFLTGYAGKMLRKTISYQEEIPPPQKTE